jgi:hypothetical protein
MCKGLDLRWGMLDLLKGTQGRQSPQARLTNGAPGVRLSSGSAAKNAAIVTVCSNAVRTVCIKTSTLAATRQGLNLD